jgi:exopolysaccharide biosynthesis polyprenyl glycosylphosphotransferase
MIMQGVAARRDLGYELVGFVHTRLESAGSVARVEEGPEVRSLTDFGRFRSLGFATDVPLVLQRENVDEVIIALPAAAHEEIWPILQECESKGVGFKIVPDTFELSLGRVQVDDIAGIPLLDVRDQPLRKFKIAIKQLADLILGFLLAVLFSPVMLVTAIAVRFDSPGPLLYRAQRVGQNGKVFTCYKFRSMHKEAEEQVSRLRPLSDAEGPIFKMKDDPRCTRVGRVIRRHSVDELPQLWNVLRREMSLVGPRPAFPSEVSKYETWQRRRLLSRPGITGMWQVNGRSDLSFDEMVMLDIYYIENWSLILDIKILLRTVAAMITGRGAY